MSKPRLLREAFATSQVPDWNPSVPVSERLIQVSLPLFPVELLANANHRRPQMMVQVLGRLGLSSGLLVSALLIPGSCRLLGSEPVISLLSASLPFK